MSLPSHTLGDYLSLLKQYNLVTAASDILPDTPISLVSCDSRNVQPNTLFICKGAHFRAEFLTMAEQQGAVVYVSEHNYPDCSLPCILVHDLREAMARLADFYYHHPSGSLSVIGFTGTKGKSSAAYYLKSILDTFLNGQPETGVVSSIHTYDGVERFESHLTTPEPLELQKHFYHALQSHIPYLTMEVSSQALKYHRSLCTEFAAACFLNIGYDHISPIEHPDFEDYFASKLKIFAQSHVNCVNLDCDYKERILASAKEAGKPIITFSQKDTHADVYGSQVRKEDGQICFWVRTPRYEREFRLTMPGLFNVENALGAIAVCEALNIPDAAIYTGLIHARVPGRMETYANADGSVCTIVDYAHNRLSFETLFRSVRAEYPERTMSIVFGCPGKKAIDRRKDLGLAAGEWCDRVYLTEEDSGEENTLDICRQVASYVEQAGCTPHIIENRGEAIRQAILDCDGPSVILLTGKGQETRQKRGQEYIDTPTDVEYAQAFLQEYDLRNKLDGSSPAKAALSILPALEEKCGETWILCCPDQLGTVEQDALALLRAKLRIILLKPSTQPISAQLSGCAVSLSASDGGLLKKAASGYTVQPKLLDTLLSGGFLPVVDGSINEAQAIAQAMKAQRLVFFCPEEPSLALGENRQVELLHLNSQKAGELLAEGTLSHDWTVLLNAARDCVDLGVNCVSLLHATQPHALLLEALGQQVFGSTLHRTEQV